MSKDFNLILKKANLKVTPTRLAILDVFSGDCKLVNAEYVFEKLKTKKIHLVTIYRTIASFEKAAILKRVNLHKGSMYYELGDHHHHHIVCTDCGATESFDKCDAEGLSRRVLRKSSTFKTISQHAFEFFGVCKSCAKG